MNHLEQSPPRRLGLSATLDAALCRHVTPSFLPLVAFAIILLFAILASPATAATLGTPDEAGSAAGELALPEGIAVDRASGAIYVADSGNRRIDKFSSSGQFLLAFGYGVASGAHEPQSCGPAANPSTVECHRGILPRGAAAGELAEPTAVAVDQTTHDIYVRDQGFSRVEKFDPEGNVILTFGGDAVAQGPGNSSNDERQEVTVAATGGTFSLRFPYPFSQRYDESTVSAETAPLAADATAAQVASALNGLSTIGGLGGSVTVTGGPGDATGSSPYHVTFEGALSGDDVPALQATNGLTGAGGAISVTTEHPGGGPEICGPVDACKEGDLGAANGQFESLPFTQRGVAADLLATGPEGQVYVADRGRVQEFDSSGSYTGQLSFPGDRNVRALAVNSLGDVYLTAEGLSGVHEYTSAGAELATLDSSGEPVALATNALDELYVRDTAGGGVQILAYDSSGLQTLLVRAPQLDHSEEEGGAFNGNGGVAFDDSTALIYGSNPNRAAVFSYPLPPPGPGIEAGTVRAAEILSTTTAVAAEVNPHSHPTTFHVQYVDDAHFQNEGGFNSAHTQVTAESGSIGSDFTAHEVEAHLTDLQPETTYDFRFVATNERGTAVGEDVTFATEPAATFAVQAPESITPTGAVLRTYMNPLGNDTTYRFQYGPDEGNYPDSTELRDAGAGAALALQTAAISGLQPDTTYHFHLLATNSAGTIASPDFAFTTAPGVCPNEALRVEDHSLALPDCRAYEQVSPVDKAGQPASGPSPALSGERILFSSLGTFAGEPSDGGNYLATRGSDGWTTVGIDPAPSIVSNPVVRAATPELTRFVSEFSGLDGVSLTTATAGAFFERSPDGIFVQASPTVQAVGSPPSLEDLNSGTLLNGAVSTDLSTIVFPSRTRLLPADSLPSESEIGSPTINRFYQVTGLGTPSSRLSLLAVDGQGTQIPPCDSAGQATYGQSLGGSGGLGRMDPNSFSSKAGAVSADGSKVFFTLVSPSLPGGCARNEGSNGGFLAYHVLARVDDSKTIDLSVPNLSCSACEGLPPEGGSDFQTASADGSKVFFESPQRLTNDATADPFPGDIGARNVDSCWRQGLGSGCNLYMYDFSKPDGNRLVDLSAGDSSGSGPGVRGVLKASADGSLVYFVAGGLLTRGPNSLGQFAQEGADNLYVASSETGRVSFVAELCRDSERSGELADALCPTDTGEGSRGPLDLAGIVPSASSVHAQFALSPDGRYLVFRTYAQLTPDDRNQAADIYRYDTVTGSLIRVSVGHDGEGDDGNVGGQDATLVDAFPSITGLGSSLGEAPAAISNDGQTIVFNTARRLQASDENGLRNAYIWHQGQVDLVSGGRSVLPNESVAVSASGRDVVFESAQGLLPSDTDGLIDTYDARIGGGFPLLKQPPPPCESGDACHGEGTHPGQEPVFGSGSLKHQAETVPCPKHFVRRHGHCIKRHHKRPKRHRHHKRSARHNFGGHK